MKTSVVRERAHARTQAALEEVHSWTGVEWGEASADEAWWG